MHVIVNTAHRGERTGEARPRALLTTTGPCTTMVAGRFLASYVIRLVHATNMQGQRLSVQLVHKGYSCELNTVAVTECVSAHLHPCWLLWLSPLHAGITVEVAEIILRFHIHRAV